MTDNKLIRVFMDGCFDILHPGHCNAIRQAKKLGDILIIGVHSDKEILKHKKCPTIMNNKERVAALKACKYVDEVIYDVPYKMSLSLLNQLKADFVVHGDDISTLSDGTDSYIELRHIGKLKTIKRTEGVSTTILLERIISRYNNTSIVRSPFLLTSDTLHKFSNNKTPRKDDIVVYICGNFDLLHEGHIKLFKEISKLGNFLYVGLYKDVNDNNIMNINERSISLLSCKYVDEIIINVPPLISIEMIERLKINMIVIDINDKNLDYKEIINLNIIKLMDINIIEKTNRIINRVINDLDKYVNKK